MIIHGAKPRSDPEVIKARISKLLAAFREVTRVMHECDGTQEDSEFGTPEMRVAHTYLHTTWLRVKDAVEEN